MAKKNVLKVSQVEAMGMEAIDTITGFYGTITGYAQYITGCDQVCLTPKVKEDGKMPQGQYIDINRIKLTGGNKKTVDTKENKGAMDSPHK